DHNDEGVSFRICGKLIPDDRDCRKETKTVQYARVPLADGRREHLKAGCEKAPDKHSCLTRGLTFFLQQEEG
ncbi:hypothetical protein MMS21_29425, partial [Escherichia coli]|nr:hypothetical protein [Escherichia coli]